MGQDYFLPHTFRFTVHNLSFKTMKFVRDH